MGFGAKLEDRRSQRSLLLRGWIGSGAALACALVTPALAQSSSALPTREELQQPPILSAPPQRLQAITADDLEIERAPCPLAHPDYQNIRFTLRSVSFTGSEFADNEALSPSWTA